MTTTMIRQKLISYMQVANEKKIKAMYTLVADDIEQEELQYTSEFKGEIDKRYAYYKNGGKMISAVDADKQINKILQTGKRK